MSTPIIPWEEIIARINQICNIKSVEDWDDKSRILALQEEIRLKVTEAISHDPGLARVFFDNPKEFLEFDALDVEGRKEYINRKENGFDQAHFVTLHENTIKNAVTGITTRPQNRIRVCFSIYLSGNEGTIESNQPQKKTIIQKQNNENPAAEVVFNRYLDKCWKVYYYHYSERQRKGLLGMAMLLIDETGKAEFKNITSDTSTDYKGRMYVESTFQHLVFDLYSSELLGKHVDITVFVGQGSFYPLLVGVYKNIYSTNSMVAGTIILEQSEKKLWNGFRPMAIDFLNCEEMGLDNDIVSYLRERSFNFIKAPSKILSKDQLRLWLENRKPS